MRRKIKKVPRPKDRLETESRLLAAAKEVFSEHGYTGATTRMIAEKSEVNLGLITRYFGSKRGMLLAIIQRESDAFWDKPLPYPPQPSFIKECICFTQTRFNLMTEQIAFFRIVIIQIITDPELKKDLIRQTFKSTSTMEDRLKSFQEFKAIRGPKSLSSIIEQLERTVAATVLLDYLISELSKEECLKRLEEATKLIAKSALGRD